MSKFNFLSGVNNANTNKNIFEENKKKLEQESLEAEKMITTKHVAFDRETYTIGGNDPSKGYDRFNIRRFSVHFGQLKLFFSELQFINLYWDKRDIPNPILVYVGAAKGTHIQLLSDMYPDFKMVLYDKSEFDPILKTNEKIKIEKKYFDDEEAKKWSSKGNIFFVCDIRNLIYNTKEMEQNLTPEEFDIENEKIVLEDMRAQERWTKIISPVQALLKFRPPYKTGSTTNFEYLKGIVYRQVWKKQDGVESRIVPTWTLKNKNENTLDIESIGSIGSGKKEYETMTYDTIIFNEQSIYHNKIVRQEMNFLNPYTDNPYEPIHKELGLTSDWDSHCSAQIIKDYLEKHGEIVTNLKIKKLLEYIMEKVTLGRNSVFEIRYKNKKDFDDVEE